MNQFYYELETWNLQITKKPFDIWLNEKGAKGWELCFMSNSWNEQGTKTRVDCVFKHKLYSTV